MKPDQQGLHEMTYKPYRTKPDWTKPDQSEHIFSKSPAGEAYSIYVTAVLTSDDVAIAILVAVLVLFGRFPGRRLSLRQGLNMHTHTHTQIVSYCHIEVWTHRNMHAHMAWCPELVNGHMGRQTLKQDRNINEKPIDW